MHADSFTPTHPRLGKFVYKTSLPVLEKLLPAVGWYRENHPYTKQQAANFRTRLEKGEPIFLAGFHSGSHNAGLALVKVTQKNGVELLANNEEERFQGIKHYDRFPVHSLETLIHQLSATGRKPEDVFAYLEAFDQAGFIAFNMRLIGEEIPKSFSLLSRSAWSHAPDSLVNVLKVSATLGERSGIGRKVPIIGQNHHGNHAYFSYAVSPFAHSGETTIITVVDGNGDDGSISYFLARGRSIKRLYSNDSFYDSLGTMYRILSASQGGWKPLSSEGRYMGAAAWGNMDRESNPFYEKIRPLIFLGDEGRVLLNRSLANWQRQGWVRPYTPRLEAILGPPILLDGLWNPDNVIKIDATSDNIDQNRVDKAAAIQMLFEDALVHIIRNLVLKTGSSRLVLTGGTALNCVANSKLLEIFDEDFYERHLGKKSTRLNIWVPPTPGDQGAVIGAAYQFAMKNGASPGAPLQHAFYCGGSYTSREIVAGLAAVEDVGYLHLNNVHEPRTMAKLADLMAFMVSRNAIIGIYQGRSETGPRALGHRSILANPCNPHTLTQLNRQVKFREIFRPLAPMATYAAAKKYFALSDGASCLQHNAYNYMVLTAQARPEAYQAIPAVIHKDGTARVQVVRREVDPLSHAFLVAMGVRLGVEVSVNTSLNIGSPIVQTPVQAIETLRRARALDGLFLVGEEGDAYLAWNKQVSSPNGGTMRINALLSAWRDDTGAAFLHTSPG